MNSPFNVRPESWPRLSALLDEAFELDATARAALVATTRAHDAELGAELARLLPDIGAAAASATVASAAPFTTLLQRALGDDAQDSTGLTFGAWTLVDKLGQGGMGEVWRALRSDGMFVGSAAIKLLRSDLPAARLAARFARERAVLARLNHPNIARLLDAGVAHDQAFIVLELVEGLPLLEYVQARALTVADRVRLIRDIARAVEHAHSQLVLHRDLKPSNVLVTADGTAKLLDFGIAAALDEAAPNEAAPNLTQLSGRGHTLEYAAPEQILGAPTVAASDVYSLGAMLFHLLTGRRPFADSANRAALEYAAVHTEAPRASLSIAPAVAPEAAPAGAGTDLIAAPADAQNIPGDLDAIISKALRKSPADRYATASVFVSDLDAWLARTPISIRAEDRSYRSRLWFRRNWMFAALGAVTATAVIVGLAFSLWQRSEAIAAAILAKDEAARATRVADYLGELIGSASPDKHGGNWPSVLALLEKSEKELATEFKDDPKTHAILLKRMLDTNDALNRDTVAYAQSQQLDALLATIQPPNVELQLDNRQQQGWLLRRLGRYDEALALDAQTLAGFAAHYGNNSVEYAKLLLSQGSTFTGLGRFDEARAKLDEGYALLAKLQPGNLKNTLDEANDKTVMLTQQNRWQEAMDALSAMEPVFKTVADRGGKELRDVLIIRNNLEAIRIRLGHYENALTRLRVIDDDGTRLLGPDNMISLKARSLQVSVACETGAFADCLRLERERFDSIQRRVGIEPAELVEAELDLRSTEVLLQQVAPSAARDVLQRLTAAIATTRPTPSSDRVYLYRAAADAAIRAGEVDLATTAVTKARADVVAAKVSVLARVAQVDRAEAGIAFLKGEPARAAALLASRFRAHEAVREDTTPRYATLLLQRAIYEVEFDRLAAAATLAQSRAAFERAGGAQAQFKALMSYIDARITGNPVALRAAEDSVDRIYLRTRAGSDKWRVPHLSSL